MKVLLDTNVLLDYFLNREPYYKDSIGVFSYCLFMVQGYISAHSIIDLFYQMHERAKKSVEFCRNTFIKLCKTFEICSIDKSSIMDAAHNMTFDDFEDALQSGCAEMAKVDYIVTRNLDDFQGSAVKAISPEEFLIIMDRIK